MFIPFRNSLAVQWLGLQAFTAGATGSIPGQGIKIPQAARRGQKKKFIPFKFSKEEGLGNMKWPECEGLVLSKACDSGLS